MRDAATVIVMRRAVAAPFEVLLLCRNRRSGFFGGAHVFPGGVLDLDDAVLGKTLAQEFPDCHWPLEPTPMRDASDQLAWPYAVATLRELFEETGLLLAESVAATDLRPAREALLADRTVLSRLVHEHSWRLLPQKLTYFAHWVTPSGEKRRYDTRFFLATAPSDFEATIVGTEATQLVWMSPEVALEAHRAGRIVLPPPTQLSLLQLMTAASPDEAHQQAEQRQVLPIMPKVASVAPERVVLMPWHENYATLAGEALGIPRATWTEAGYAALPGRVAL